MYFAWKYMQWNLDITKSPVWRTMFFTPVTTKWMKKNLDITKPRSSEQILPVPWPFVMSRFHCTKRGHAEERQYLHCLVFLSISRVTVIKPATSRSTVEFSCRIKKTLIKAKQPQHANCWLEIHCTVQYIGWNFGKRVPRFTNTLAVQDVYVPISSEQFFEVVR